MVCNVYSSLLLELLLPRSPSPNSSQQQSRDAWRSWSSMAVHSLVLFFFQKRLPDRQPWGSCSVIYHKFDSKWTHYPSSNLRQQGAGDMASEVKSTNYFQKTQVRYPAYTWWLTTVFNSTVPEAPVPLSNDLGCQSHMVHRQKTHTHLYIKHDGCGGIPLKKSEWIKLNKWKQKLIETCENMSYTYSKYTHTQTHFTLLCKYF